MAPSRGPSVTRRRRSAGSSGSRRRRLATTSALGAEVSARLTAARSTERKALTVLRNPQEQSGRSHTRWSADTDRNMRSGVTAATGRKSSGRRP